MIHILAVVLMLILGAIAVFGLMKSNANAMRRSSSGSRQAPHQGSTPQHGPTRHQGADPQHGTQESVTPSDNQNRNAPVDNDGRGT